MLTGIDIERVKIPTPPPDSTEQVLFWFLANPGQRREMISGTV
jgi:hypothetical protein